MLDDPRPTSDTVTMPFSDADLEVVRAVFPAANGWAASTELGDNGPTITVTKVRASDVAGRIVWTGRPHALIEGIGDGFADLGEFASVADAVRVMAQPLQFVCLAALAVHCAVLEAELHAPKAEHAEAA